MLKGNCNAARRRATTYAWREFFLRFSTHSSFSFTHFAQMFKQERRGCNSQTEHEKEIIHCRERRRRSSLVQFVDVMCNDYCFEHTGEEINACNCRSSFSIPSLRLPNVLINAFDNEIMIQDSKTIKNDYDSSFVVDSCVHTARFLVGYSDLNSFGERMMTKSSVLSEIICLKKKSIVDHAQVICSRNIFFPSALLLVVE